ncbi:MAG: hypothetical protein AAGN82_27890 [Myxococcota bacterium]
MSADATDADPPPVGWEISLRFRFFANLFLLFFGALIGVGGLITFTVSEYSRDTDFVFRFYGVFNPCILIDHYPANVVGVITTSAMLFASMGFIVTALLYVLNMKGAKLLSLSVGFLMALHYVADLLFMNTFTANLYPHGYDHLRDAAGALRPLTATDLHHVRLHTGFYLVWLLGSLCCMAAVYRARVRTRWARTFKAAYVAGGIAVAHAILHIGQWMMNWRREGHVFTPSTWVQWLLSVPPPGVIGTLHPLAFLLFRYVFPAHAGVRLSFTLADPGGDPEAQETLDPERWIARAFRIFGASLLVTYLFRDPADVGAPWATQMIIFSGFGVPPYNYLFVPVFVAVGHAFAVGVGLTIVRSGLMRGRRHGRTRGLMAVGGVLIFLTWAALWLVIPQFDTRGAQALIGALLFPGWVGLTFGLRRRTVLFVVVWVSALISSVAAVGPTAETVANLVLVGLLMFYGELMPGEDDVPSLALRAENLAEGGRDAEDGERSP